jgi:hypothetical protein
VNQPAAEGDESESDREENTPERRVGCITITTGRTLGQTGEIKRRAPRSEEYIPRKPRRILRLSGRDPAEVRRWKELFDQVLFDYIHAGPDYMTRAESSIWGVFDDNFSDLQPADPEEVIHAVSPPCPHPPVYES